MKSWLKIKAMFLIFIFSASFSTVNAQRHHNKDRKYYYKSVKHHHKRVAHHYRKPQRHLYYGSVAHHRSSRLAYKQNNRKMRHYSPRKTVIVINHR
ncbi:hypothetical protein [Chryseobacterium sp.]|uniref:hypothetical protein n=2 Tax=Chryseobacterium sp. TaxID=1871047 RepID=UPI002FCC5130